ncbi:hypothetical protein [Longimicrobium sp.]|uniref:hypothetical protein n=1 Tax=Longimicrobium sp. TaxID=2029185 RepID=UPI002E364278|nr:hypothetical protein [Longimicrobium sp.]HEX6041980.1 hypothetical protein [Longimicrobium sp.]
MNEHDEDELTPDLRNHLQALPREMDPGRLLEERTVRALRERGLIEAPAAGGRIRRIPRAWLGGAVAAGIALFASGLATGQWVGARTTAQAVQATHAADTRQAALAVQQTGTAYVAAMSRFAELQDSAAAGQTAQGREVAARMLRAAADELVRIAPDDPLAAAVLAAFARADSAKSAQSGEKQGVVWF